MLWDSLVETRYHNQEIYSMKHSETVVFLKMLRRSASVRAPTPRVWKACFVLEDPVSSRASGTRGDVY